MRNHKQYFEERNHFWMMTIALATLITMWIAMIGISLTLWYPWNPVPKLEIKVLEHRITPRPGGMLHVEVDYCKTRNWMAEDIRWSLVNDVTVLLPTSARSFPMGCHVISVFVPLPHHIAPAPYKLNVELRYRPWPWVDITYTKESPQFVLKATQ